MSQRGREHLSRDPVLKAIVSSLRLRRRPVERDVFAALLRTIVYQQLAGHAAAAIHGRFLSLFASQDPRPVLLLDQPVEQLREVGLSQRKAMYLRNVAEFWIDQELDAVHWRELSDEEIVALLTQIQGVGEWSAQMILMFSLRRPDVFPTNDLGIQNAMVRAYRLRSQGKKLQQRMVRIADPWRPYRTLACRYLWQYLDQ